VVPVDSCGSDVACGKYDAGHTVPVVVYQGAPGQGNRLTVSRAGDDWTLTDPGAPVTVGDDCRVVDAHTAVCTAASALEAIPAFSAQLGDGDDSVAIAGALGVRTSLEGGPGADTLTGGAEADTFFGGPGADRIDGGEDNDFIYAKDNTRDVVQCGTGNDWAQVDRTWYGGLLDSVYAGCETLAS
jgi:Ca2+-binding RTX toxin-like protein